MRVLVATLVMTMCVGTAAAGPPGTTQPAKKSEAPARATFVSSLVVLAGALVAYEGAFPSCYDRDCASDEKQMAIGGAILLLGPTLVRLPAREAGAIHLGIRIAGAAVITASAMSYSSDEGPLLIGAGLLVAGAISDVVTVHGAYRRRNERRALSIAPVTMTPGGALAPGVSLGGRF